MKFWRIAASTKALVCVFYTSCFVFAAGTILCPSVKAADEDSNESRVLVVFVFDKSCRISCDAVRPIFRQLKGDYGEKVKFVELDVSRDVIAESQKTAKALKVGRFLDDTEDWYPAVGVFTGSRKKVKEILGAKPKEQYVQAIEKALSVQEKEEPVKKSAK
jgi:thiol-disulfide isomerase/thioredoxin